jgi:hypothetical protein
MPVVQAGALNTTALVVPDLYVQIVPPQNLVINGVPSNRIGIVGTATWGPVGVATICSTMSDYATQFGAIQARKYDMGTALAVAVQQGAADFRCVRVTDGTDVAAAVVVQTNCITFTARYTGSLGNSITVYIGNGSKSGTFSVVVGLPGLQPEKFDNISGSGNALWVAMAAAINSGTSTVRGPSQIISATAGAGTSAPTLAALALGTTTSGTDGATTITAATLVGVDTGSRTGMYALRGQGCAIAVLADADDTTQYTYQAAFGLQEEIYMILTGPAGDTITNAVTTKATAGLDSYACKLMFGDWLWWSDQVNGIFRLVSPQGFVAGRLGNLSPEQSSLNKQIYGVVGSQKSGFPGSGQAQKYSTADLTALLSAGIDVISNPQPGGSYWGVRGGHNSSSNAAINGDNYTRLTNYIATTLNAAMGLFVGMPITSDLFNQIRSTELSFLQNMLSQKLLGSLDGSLPFSVICDLTNNPPTRTALGYVQSDTQVKYLSINEKFIVNIEGGQTVTVSQPVASTST